MNAVAGVRGQWLILSLYGLPARPTMAHWSGHNTWDASRLGLLLEAITYCVLRIYFTQYAIRNT